MVGVDEVVVLLEGVCAGAVLLRDLDVVRIGVVVVLAVAGVVVLGHISPQRACIRLAPPLDLADRRGTSPYARPRSALLVSHS